MPPKVHSISDGAQYAEEERKKIIQYVNALKATQLATFLEEHDLRKSGTKVELKARIENALSTGGIPYDDLIDLLDATVPWGKQHVFFFDGPSNRVQNWRRADWVSQHLARHRVERFLHARVPLILPEKMRLSSIQYGDNRLRVIAIERRDNWERNEDLDRKTESSRGREVHLRAYENNVLRTMAILEWNLTANTATLQVTQLATGSEYEEVRDRFAKLVRPWLDLDGFPGLDIRNAIKRLHEAEENGTPEARSHNIDYRTLGGRTLSGRSATTVDSLLGEQIVDDAMRNLRQNGVGHLGNFFWLPQAQNATNGNPLTAELHLIIVADKGRINFTTPSNEASIRYVVSRVRALSV